MNRARILSSLLAWALAFTFSVACSHKEETGHKRPNANVILISLDTLRPDHLGCYGYGKKTSPHLDAFAKDGVLFKNAVSQSATTLPSHVSVFTSMIPSHHGTDFRRKTVVPKDCPTMASILKDRGYGAVSFNNGGMLSSVYGVDQGFDLYHTIQCKRFLDSKFITPIKAAEDWLINNHSRKFFLFLHTYEMHAPYLPWLKNLSLFEPEYRGAIPIHRVHVTAEQMCLDHQSGGNMIHDLPKDKITRTTDMEIIPISVISRMNTGVTKVTKYDLEHLTNAYDASLRSVDESFQVFMNRLKEMGQYDNAMIIVFSDHGEEFLEHGKVAVHSHTLYDELLRVVLMIKFPGQSFAGEVVHDQVRSIDILPTMLDVLDIPLPSTIEGNSLINTIREKGKAPDLSISQIVRKDLTYSTSIRTKRWKLYDSKLYDLKTDPLETNNVADQYPKIKLQLTRAMKKKLKANPYNLKNDLAKISRELEQRLKELGY